MIFIRCISILIGIISFAAAAMENNFSLTDNASSREITTTAPTNASIPVHINLEITIDESSMQYPLELGIQVIDKKTITFQLIQRIKQNNQT